MDSCRTCLREAIADRGFGLFDPDVRPATDLLIASTSLKIAKNDGLPARICTDCFAKLSSFQVFCQQSIETDIIHRKNQLVKVELGNDEEIVAKDRDRNPVAKQPNIKSEAKWIEPADNDDIGVDDDRAHDDDDDDDDDDDNVDRPDEKLDPIQSTNITTSPPPVPATTADARPKRKYARRTAARPVDKSTKYTCDECGKFYYEKERLAGHLRQHFGLRPFPCDRCPKQYDHYCKLREHQQKHQLDQPTVCPHEGCGKTYRLPFYAQDHYERIHLGLRQKVRVDVECVCDTCGKSFRNRPSLLQHMKSHMDIEQYPYQCEVCGKRFLAKNNHMLHMLRHNNIRNFPCPLCPARMVSQLELKNHVSKHDKSVPWPCPECTMVFRRKALLRRHELKVHRGYKPYVCSYCSRAFGMKQLMVKHERLHTGERPFACPICDRRFVQEAHMKSHVKTHNKQKDANR